MNRPRLIAALMLLPFWLSSPRALAQPDTTQPDAAKPDAAKPDDPQPDAAKPDDPQPDAAKPGRVNPGDMPAGGTQLGGSRGEPLEEQDVVQEAMANNPGLRASLYDFQQAEDNMLAEDASYMPKLLFDLGATHTETPRLTGNSTTDSSNNTFDLGVEYQHTLSWGTALSVRLEGNRSTSVSQFAVGTEQLVTIGPGYGISGRFSITQPLLRGFGNDVGHSAVRQARLSRTIAERTRDQDASEVLRDALVGYWELWHAERARAIEVEGLMLALRRYNATKRTIELGGGAPVELLTFETRVAELSQSVVAAEAQWRQQSLQLGLLMGRDPSKADALHAAASQVPVAAARDRDEVLKAALEQSQLVAQQKVQLELANERALVAGEAARPRLDIEAYLQTQGLGNKSATPALEQFGTFGAISAHAGLVFELPLSGSRRSAQRRAASASADATRERLFAAEQQARADVASQLLSLAQAQRRAQLAATMAEVATRNAAAQQQRYDAGDAIVLEIHDAEDTARRAKLAATRALVDARQASIRIDHLIGKLLRRYAAVIPDKPAKLVPHASAGMLRPGPF